MKKSPLFALLLIGLVLLAPSSGAATEERSIEFVSPDELRLEGVIVYPSPESGFEAPFPVAILVHHHGRTRDSLLALADSLAGRGIASVVMDQRGHGQSRLLEGRPTLYTFPILPESHIRRGTYDQAQVYDAVARDERLDEGRLALVGVGIGSLVAAEASWRSVGATDALVLVDPAAPVAGFRPTRDLGLFGERPVLIVCSALARSEAMARRLAGYGHGTRDAQCVEDFEVTDRLLRPGMPALDVVGDWLERVLVGAAS